MGASTGAGVIFGTTGGVMEAVLRSVYEIYTGRTLDNVNFEQVRGLAGVRRATIDLDGFELKVGIAHGLGNARHLLEDIRNGHNEYHVIEIMACPGGCIGGGGQPLHHGNSDVLYARANTRCIARTPTNRCGSRTRTPISRHCMKSIWASRSVKPRNICCIHTTSTSLWINR